MFERGLSHKELASELGISSVQVENLRTGVTKLPGERISNKIINYCEQHDIDIDINWNDVLYDIFSESEQYKGYTWVRDLDEDGYVVLKHKECGRKTLVPRQSFGYKSTPCIHCWVDKYVSSEVYDVDTSEDTYRHRFTHKCGHSYSVTYEDIKQKKFRCPVCNGYRYNADNANRNRNTGSGSTTSTPRPPVIHQAPLWDERLKERIISVATEYGFSVEDRDTLHCNLHYPNMTNRQFAFICNTCFDSEVFDKDESSIQKIIDFAIRHKCECEKPDDCFIENTKRQSIVWIPDVERILHMVSLTAQGGNNISGIIEKLQGEEYSKEVYVAGVAKPEDGKTAHLFYHYYNDNDATDYINLLVSNTPSNFGEMTFYALPKAYTDSLYEHILLSMNQKTENSAALQKSCDEYVDMVNYFKAHNQQIFIYAALSKFTKNLGSLLHQDDVSSQRQQDAEKVLSVQHCPVCRSLHNSTARFCDDCGFDELNMLFINKDEFELWLNEVVLPARNRRENNE